MSSNTNLTIEEEKNLYYFEDIFDNCPTHNLEDSKTIFKNNFKFDMDDILILDSLDIVASGSIGQVYKAQLIITLHGGLKMFCKVFYMFFIIWKYNC